MLASTDRRRLPLAQTPTVVVFETQDCELCEDFRRKIGKPHRASQLGEKAPLTYYDVTEGQPPKRFNLAGAIGHSPTAVVFDVYGREVKRIVGLPKTLDDFQGPAQSAHPPRGNAISRIRARAAGAALRLIQKVTAAFNFTATS